MIAYAEKDGRIHLDDRTLGPLTVAGEDVDRARARWAATGTACSQSAPATA